MPKVIATEYASPASFTFMRRSPPPAGDSNALDADNGTISSAFDELDQRGQPPTAIAAAALACHPRGAGLNERTIGFRVQPLSRARKESSSGN